MALELFLLACLVGLCLPAWGEECPRPQLENTVRLTTLADDAKMAVPVLLNGVKKTFLFDTGGGSVNYISSAVARELKLRPFASGRSVDISGNISDRAAEVEKVGLGNATASHVVFQIVPHLAYDGILSAGAMAALHLGDDDIDMDFGAMRLNFFSADHCQASVVTWPHRVLAVMPVTRVTGHIEIEASLDGHPLMAVLDTGSPWTTVNLSWARQNLGFQPKAGLVRGLPRAESGNRIFFRRYFALFFPGVTVTDPLVIVRPIQFRGWNEGPVLGSIAPRLSADANRLDPDMIIGLEVLRHLHIYYAVKEQKLYITPASAGQDGSLAQGLSDEGS